MMLLLVFLQVRVLVCHTLHCDGLVATTTVDPLPDALSRLSQLPVSLAVACARAPIIVSSCFASVWKVSGFIPRTVKYVACYNGFVLT